MLFLRFASRRLISATAAVLSFTLLSLALPAHAAEEEGIDDYLNLSLEQLSNVKITSVSKHSESVRTAAAAVFVLTQDDIRRLGVTSVPEALRFVPGVQVAHVDATRWRISTRGFNDSF